jgi:acetyl-CoA acetyltransferase
MPKRNFAAVVGVGWTPVGTHPGRSPYALMAQAAGRALSDAGLMKADVDGLIVIPSLVQPSIMPAATFIDYFGLSLQRFSSQPGLGGASGCAAIRHAAMAIATGTARVVLIVAGDSTVSGRPPGAYASADEFEAPYGASAPALYALYAQRHMHEFGTTETQLAEVSVACRSHAALNPDAQHREPLTVEDVLDSPMVAHPLRRLHCCPMADGGCAAVVTSAEAARDMPKAPVLLLGSGECHTHDKVWGATDFVSTGAAESGRQAFAEARLGPGDIDVAEIYDCFSITPIVFLEDLGFCAKGEGGPFVEGGRIRLGGELPVNTHGGLLSMGQPGMAGGLFHAVEAVVQLRGDAGERQVPGAEVALAHGNGGIFGTQCTLIFGTA